jgi:hypothetical protein
MGKEARSQSTNRRYCESFARVACVALPRSSVLGSTSMNPPTKKPRMLVEHKTGDCVTIARCSACGLLFYGPFFVDGATSYNEKMKELFEAHVAQSHTGEAGVADGAN